MVFDANACRHLADDVTVLRVDTRVDCAADSYAAIQLVGWLMGLCWVLGVPLYWLVCLMKNKEAIQTTGEGGRTTMAAKRYVSLSPQGTQRVWTVHAPTNSYPPQSFTHCALCHLVPASPLPSPLDPKNFLVGAYKPITGLQS